MTKRGSKKRKGSRSKRMYGGLGDAVGAIPPQTVNAEHVKEAEEKIATVTEELEKLTDEIAKMKSAIKAETEDASKTKMNINLKYNEGLHEAYTKELEAANTNLSAVKTTSETEKTQLEKLYTAQINTSHQLLIRASAQTDADTNPNSEDAKNAVEKAEADLKKAEAEEAKLQNPAASPSVSAPAAADTDPNSEDAKNAVEKVEAEEEEANLQNLAASSSVSAPAAASGAVKKDLTEVNRFRTFWNEATGSISVVSDTAPDIKTYVENTEKKVSLADAAATPVAAKPVGVLGGRRSRKIKRSRRKGSRRNRRR